MRHNGILLCELDLWGHAGVEVEELWLFTDVLYPIIFMLSGGRNGKHGLNGAFHMWSNSLLTSGCGYQLSMCFLVGLLLSCVSWCTRTRRWLLFGNVKGCCNFKKRNLFQRSEMIALLLDRIKYYFCTLCDAFQHVFTSHLSPLFTWISFNVSIM